MTSAAQMAETKLFRRTLAEIDLNQLKANFREIRRDAGGFLCPMVKANAYGHGDIQVVKALREEGAEFVGVGLIEEALRLRAQGDQGRILNFGVEHLDYHLQGADEMIAHKITPVISQWSQLESLEQMLQRKKQTRFVIHLKFNTGMNRLGFEMHDVDKLHAWLASKTCFLVEGVCTHLLNAEDLGDSEGYSHRQLQRFEQVRKKFSDAQHAHVFNSAAVEESAKHNTLGLRPGIALYKDVMTLKTEIVALHALQAGDVVSYGATWKAAKSSFVGVLSLGYADGLKRILSNRAQVLFRGERVPLIGRICMDYAMLDLTSVHEQQSDRPIQLHEEVVIFGHQGAGFISAEEQATHAETISYEIFTGVSSRVPRVYSV